MLRIRGSLQYFAGIGLVSFAILTAPIGGFGSILDFVYPPLFAIGMLLMFSSPDDLISDGSAGR